MFQDENIGQKAVKPKKRRKKVKKLLTLLFLGGALLALRVPNARAGGAVVVATDYCLVFDATCGADHQYAVPVRQFSVTNDPGNSTITCKGNLAINPSAELPNHGAVKCDFANTGQNCTGAKPDGTPDFSKLSTDWTEVVSPSGEFSLVCHFKGN